MALPIVRRSMLGAVTRRPFYNGNVEQFAAWARASHSLRVVHSREFVRQRRRTAQELSAAAARGVVVVRLRGSRQAQRWLEAQRA